MENNKLISMTDFVLEQSKDKPFVERFTNCYNYAYFLKQPLELWMFVPCDENNAPLEEQNHLFLGLHSCNWQQAKERVLFEHEKYDLKNIFLLNDICTVESLVKYGLTLTPTAMKQIYGK